MISMFLQASGWSDVSLWVLAASVVASLASTFYVKTTGNDALDGLSVGNAWLTIQYGISQLNSGDSLIIKAGTYTDRISAGDFAHTGTAWTAGNFITIKAADGETVTVRVGSGGNVASFPGSTIHHVLLQNLILDGYDAGGSYGGAVLYFGDTSHDLHFQNLEVKDGEGVGVLGSGDSHSLVDMNVHGNGRSAIIDHLYHHNNGCYLSIITNSVITGGRYWDNLCAGLRVGSSGATNATNNIIDGVLAYQNGAGNGLGGLSDCDSTGCGILLADVDNIIKNCVVYGNTEGIVLYGLSSKTATGLKVYNNTIYDNDAAGINVNVSLVSGAKLKNNIIYGNGSTISDSGSGTDAGASNLTTNPSFTNAGAHDFTLQVGSAALDVGIDLISQGVTLDFAGNLRPSGHFDIGAYQMTLTGGGPGGGGKTSVFVSSTLCSHVLVAA